MPTDHHGQQTNPLECRALAAEANLQAGEGARLGPRLSPAGEEAVYESDHGPGSCHIPHKGIGVPRRTHTLTSLGIGV
jgi:hypothetical protein